MTSSPDIWAGGYVDVTLAALADSANISQEGKLNILGEFNQIYATSLPAQHSAMSLVLRLEAGPVEYGQEKHVEIRLVDADGNSVLNVGTAKVPVPNAGPGKRARIITVLNIQNTVLESFGDYAFVVLVNGDEKATVPLELVQIDAAEKEGSTDAQRAT